MYRSFVVELQSIRSHDFLFLHRSKVLNQTTGQQRFESNANEILKGILLTRQVPEDCHENSLEIMLFSKYIQQWEFADNKHVA